MGVAQGKDMVVAERIAGWRRRGVDEDGAQGEGEWGAEAVSGGVKQQVEESDRIQTDKNSSCDEQLRGAGNRKEQGMCLT